MNQENHFQVHVSEKCTIIRVIGKASYLNCGSIRTFLDKSLVNGQKIYFVDFAECTSMDSTFLGILVGLAMKLRKIAAVDKPTLCNLKGRNLETVRNLGVHRITNICDAKNLIDEELTTLENQSPADSNIIRYVYLALLSTL